MDLEKNSEKHPPALYWLFFTEMWERFSYYGMRALLTLFLVSTFMKGDMRTTVSTLLAEKEIKVQELFKSSKLSKEEIQVVAKELKPTTQEIALVAQVKALTKKSGKTQAEDAFIEKSKKEKEALDKQREEKIDALGKKCGIKKNEADILVKSINLTNEEKELAAKEELSTKEAGNIYGIYTGLAYILTLIGGYLADKFFGFRKTVYIGGVLMAAAQFTLAFGAYSESIPFFYLGLGLLVVGNGLFKPNISSMVGQYYINGSALKDSAYTIFYMGINIGAFLGAIICGYLGEEIAWHYGFMAAGIGMIIGLIIFYMAQKHLGDVGLALVKKSKELELADNQPLTLIEKQKLAVACILSFFSIIFWASFEQAGSSMSIFAKNYTDRMLGSFEVPATWFQSVNSMFIFMLAPLFSMLWIALDRKNMNPNGAVKFALGLLLVALGFAVLVVGAGSIPQGANAAQVSMMWLLGAYCLHTMGELCLSPVGLSFINKLSPPRFFGLMFGVWFVASGCGNYLGGWLSGFIGDSDAYSISDFFKIVVIVPLIAAIVLLAISPLLKKWMHGVK